jgi:hypothetical protein
VHAAAHGRRLVPDLKQFYVVHPKVAAGNASLLLYRVNP